MDFDLNSKSILKIVGDYQINNTSNGGITHDKKDDVLTIVYDGGSFSICPAGNPGMAVGGMGDVLSGMISGYLAQGLSSKEASILGVFHHAVACDSLQENYGQRSLRPSILLDHLVDLEL
jgi:NAD(P)H-hydrate repair Nnr-like enzyme with NAD(P)H-hydrate dehydratase domain